MKLEIVIPALNEEKSIESIIIRSLSAIEYIKQRSPVTEVSVTVVSDGSTDRTNEIAVTFIDRIKLIVFEKNRGYGAAIKEGWSRSDADLLSFLDADGTCDPNFFADLCSLLVEKDADIVLGSRLNKNSKMPFIRRIGNTMYSLLLSLVSSEKIKDTASGMRVVRRESLPKILPLPDGLNFTPAMSARAILSQDLKILETDMAYQEREGNSKLKVLRDGIRFLGVIMKMVFLYQPYKIFNLSGILCFIFGSALMIFPIVHYIEHHEVLEWMIYRFIVSELTGITGFLLLSASYISKRIISISLFGGRKKKEVKFSTDRIFKPANAIISAILFAIIASLLIFRSVFDRITTGATYEHWSRFVAASFFYIIAFILLISVAINYILSLIDERLRYLEETGKN